MMKWEKLKREWLWGLQSIDPLNQPLVIVAIICLAYFVTGFLDWLGGK